LSDYTISTDSKRLDVELIHRWLAQESYWAPGIPRDVIERAIAGALNFGIYHATQGQVGFARVISDRATFAYLADVFVLDAHRGQGLSKRLMETILAHPELQGLRRWMLATRDAHGLY
jgi:GNAT superfamily N-acetyltransferase